MSSLPTSSANPYNIVILTPQHVITGTVTLRNQRLSDFLNDRLQTLIELQNAAVARLSEPGKILERHAEAVVAKSWIAVAFQPPEKEQTGQKRFYSYVRKQPREVYLTIDGMEIRGLLHTQREFDLHRLTATTNDDFLPLTKTTLTIEAKERFVIRQDAVIVNIRRVRYIAKVEAEAAEPGTTPGGETHVHAPDEKPDGAPDEQGGAKPAPKPSIKGRFGV